jgi:hypothetical protein
MSDTSWMTGVNVAGAGPTRAGMDAEKRAAHSRLAQALPRHVYVRKEAPTRSEAQLRSAAPDRRSRGPGIELFGSTKS